MSMLGASPWLEHTMPIPVKNVLHNVFAMLESEVDSCRPVILRASRRRVLPKAAEA